MAENDSKTEEQSTNTKPKNTDTDTPIKKDTKKETKKTSPNNLVEDGKIRPPVSRMFTLISAFAVGGLVTFGVWLVLTYHPWFTKKEQPVQQVDDGGYFSIAQSEDNVEIVQQEPYDEEPMPPLLGTTHLLEKETILDSEPEQFEDYSQPEPEPVIQPPPKIEENASNNTLSTLEGKKNDITSEDVAKKLVNIQEIPVEPASVKWSEFSKSVLSLEQERASIIAVLAQKVLRTPKKEPIPSVKKYSLRSETQIVPLKPLEPPPAKITWRYVVKQLIELEVQRERTLKQIQKKDM